MSNKIATKSLSHNQERPAPKELGFDVVHIIPAIHKLATAKNVSTARYFTFGKQGNIITDAIAVCFHAAPKLCSKAQGLGITFQGYGGFKSGDRWREATEDDLLANKNIPFVMEDQGYYNEVSLQWLDCLLNPEGPFRALLPHMMENTPEAIQDRHSFIFPEVSSVPGRLLWCFAIASRLGFANPRVVWRYLHMLKKGLSKNMALLIAGGFEHEIKYGKPTGQIIKSYTAGFLGADVTAYAGRLVYADPIIDKGVVSSTYGSSKCFESGKLDMGTLRFPDWDAVIEYCQRRADDQKATLKLAA